MIRFTQKGDLNKSYKYLQRAKVVFKASDFDKYGRAGVDILKSATPIDSGLTAESWSYKISQNRDRISIGFYNDNRNEGCPIAIILQYGHLTSSGTFVKGRDYINPSIKPLFDELASQVWKEATKV